MRSLGARGSWRIPAIVAGALICCGVAWPQASERDWSARGFEQVEIRTIEADEMGTEAGRAIDLRLPLSLVRLAGSNWTHERVMRHVRRTAGIFAACGIGLGPVQVIEARAPNGRHDLTMTTEAGLPAPRDVMDLAAMVPPNALRPPVFFVGRLHEDEALARSYRRGELSALESKQYPYLDTAWVAFKTHWIERKDEGYSTVAHELAHLLCECGHTETKQRNLLNRYRNFLSADILPETCEAMRGSPLLERAERYSGAVE